MNENNADSDVNDDTNTFMTYSQNEFEKFLRQVMKCAS